MDTITIPCSYQNSLNANFARISIKFHDDTNKNKTKKKEKNWMNMPVVVHGVHKVKRIKLQLWNYYQVKVKKTPKSGRKCINLQNEISEGRAYWTKIDFKKIFRSGTFFQQSIGKKRFNKIAIKRFLNCPLKSTFNCRFSHLWIKSYKHIMSDMRKLGRSPWLNDFNGQNIS